MKYHKLRASEIPGRYIVTDQVLSDSDIIKMAHQLARAALSKGRALTSVETAKRYISTVMAGYEHEVFACLFLDNKHRIIRFEEMFRGTIDSATVYPREVVKRALQHNAAAVMFAHNHPSGDAEPSAADRAITERLKNALDLVDIRVLDHFVVGIEETVSFTERNLI